VSAVRVLRRSSCLVFLLLGAPFQPTAVAKPTDLRVRATMSPTRIHYPGTRRVEYRLELVTGNRPRRVDVIAIPPSYARPPVARSFPEWLRDRLRALKALLVALHTGRSPMPSGAPIEPAGPLKVLGAGRALPNYVYPIPPGLSFPFPYRSCAHGYVESVSRVGLDLPTRSRTTVLARYRTGRAAPWPGTDYRVTFQVAERPDSGGRVRPQAGDYLLAWPARPHVDGATASRLTLTARPSHQVPVGRRIPIFGITKPPSPSRWVRLMFRAASPSGPFNFGPIRTLAWVQTDARGAFAYRGWRAAYPLDYEVWADPGPGGKPVDPSCSVLVTVGHRAPEASL
jgi:hypothetical protein